VFAVGMISRGVFDWADGAATNVQISKHYE
jgi:hypothetical protein